MPKVYNKHHKDAPADAVYIGRPGRYGNPYEVNIVGRDRAVDLFKKLVLSRPNLIADIKKDVEILKASMVQQRERDDRQDKASIDAASLIRSDLRELGQKMDRLIERNK